jgi:hypothetical protein
MTGPAEPAPGDAQAREQGSDVADGTSLAQDGHPAPQPSPSPGAPAAPAPSPAADHGSAEPPPDDGESDGGFVPLFAWRWPLNRQAGLELTRVRWRRPISVGPEAVWRWRAG